MARPLNKYILVDKINEEQKTEGGLLLSQEDVKDLRYAKAKVVKVGTAVDTIQEGEMIHYDKNSGYTMLIDGNPVTVILERDVVVIL